jgi:hypothetical protein
MAKLSLIVCAAIALALEPALAQTPDPLQPIPPARLIKPRVGHTDAHPATDHPRRPLDDRCRPLKEQLELELQKPGNTHKQFQARVAHNAGSRLCREGSPEKGMAEFQRGLSYLQDTPPS